MVQYSTASQGSVLYCRDLACDQLLSVGGGQRLPFESDRKLHLTEQQPSHLFSFPKRCPFHALPCGHVKNNPTHTHFNQSVNMLKDITVASLILNKQIHQYTFSYAKPGFDIGPSLKN